MHSAIDTSRQSSTLRGLVYATLAAFVMVAAGSTGAFAATKTVNVCYKHPSGRLVCEKTTVPTP